MTLVVAIAIAASLAMTPLAKALAVRFDAVSHPDGNRKLHARPTPLWGGSAVFFAVIAGVTASYRVVPGTLNTMVLLLAVGLSAGMLCLLGCYDDRYEMRARRKLLGQILSTLPVVIVGCYIERIVLFGYTLALGWLGILATVGWLVLGINAMNLLDGMDGLASAVGIAISVAIAVVSLVHGAPEVMLPALALAGALAGFLTYNLPPAKIYLGDCGSMVIGLLVATLAMQVSLASAGTVNVTIAMALLFVPLTDTALAIIRRGLLGHGLMVADRGHIHHRLLDRGLSIWSVLLILGGLSLVAGAAAWLVAVRVPDVWAWAAMGCVTALLINRRLLGHEEWKLAKRALAQTALRPARRLAPDGASALQLESATVGENLPGSIDSTASPIFSVHNDRIELPSRHGDWAAEVPGSPTRSIKSLSLFVSPSEETCNTTDSTPSPRLPDYPVLLLDLKWGMATWANDLDQAERIVRST